MAPTKSHPNAGANRLEDGASDGQKDATAPAVKQGEIGGETLDARRKNRLDAVQIGWFSVDKHEAESDKLMIGQAQPFDQLVRVRSFRKD